MLNAKQFPEELDGDAGNEMMPMDAQEVGSLVIRPTETGLTPVQAVKKFMDIVAVREQILGQVLPIALASTAPHDWVDMGGNPHCCEDGVNKIRFRFAISVSDTRTEVIMREDERGQYAIYTTRAKFSLPGSIEVFEAIGKASARAPWYAKGKGSTWRKQSEIREDNMLIHSYTNCLHNGVMGVLGIRKLTWADIEEHVKWKRKDCANVEQYKPRGDARPRQHDNDRGQNHGTKPAPKQQATGQKKDESKKPEEKRGEPTLAPETDRAAAIAHLEDIVSFLLSENDSLTETELMNSFAYKNRNGEIKPPPMDRLLQMRMVHEIAWLNERVLSLSKQYDMSGFDEWLASSPAEEQGGGE